ncbi:sterile alpha motif domain-containing protein 7 isoform X1 [Latimeria chalumnae]|uniref:sterile alpha motif domain-containing protein 7 isoform X1 n=2 Tax=Latimeria chalumnae TaxID=7897 RepID=UPI0003C13E9E|nr:PREDICTED: sterile alpha motif domain-containing protein 7 isoform X1 [Latimeria chalumnae]|eukprot:XP_005992804.1 PREDICTED: sterile alpha motif domain-containing protein 7 isoform X1 [Latimeria chalumnae]
MLMRNQMMAMNPQLMGPGQQRIQGIPPQFEPRFVDRDILSPGDMITPTEARQIHMGSHLGPTLSSHANLLPNRTYPAAGYSFMQSESMDTFARRQELIHKQNFARMEMNAILHQKEMENAHRKGLLGVETPLVYAGLPTNPNAFRGRQRMGDGALASDVYVHHTTLEDIHGSTLLMSTSPYPPISTLQRERGRRPPKRAASHKITDCSISGPKGQSEGKNIDYAMTAAEEEKEGKVEAETETLNKADQSKLNTDLSTAAAKVCKECEQGVKKSCTGNDSCSISCSESEKELTNPCAAFDDKYMYPSAIALSTLPNGFPVARSTLLPPGTNGGFLNGEDISTVEDIRKWTVDDVCNFINGLPGCSEYSQTFKDHAIDGETLPLLTEEHLLDTMGLKLGPVLKIRSQVSRRLGSMYYMMNLPLAMPLQSTSGKPIDHPSDTVSPPNCNNSIDLLGSPCAREPGNSKVLDRMAPENAEAQCDTA